jgi:F0F1-type ATP synthase epsilon subunit
MVTRRSAQDAATMISKLASERQEIERVQGVDDERITWGRGVVSSKKRNLTIDVSVANRNSTLDPTELAKNQAEERKVAKEFALLVADVIRDK